MLKNKLTKQEVEFLEESNAIEGVTDQDSYTQAAFAWIYLKGQKKMTASVVLKTHKMLMLHQPLYPNEKGYWRTVPVYIGGREGVNWMKIQSMIKDWTHLMTDKTVDWKQVHVMYEKIHPFVDGNGRTGRMFLNWHRLKLGLPILVIKNSEKLAYYQWFNEH